MLNKKCVTEVVFSFAIQVVILILMVPYTYNGRDDLAIFGFLPGLLSGSIGISLREIQKITQSKSHFFELSLVSLGLLVPIILTLVSRSLSLGAGYFFGMVITTVTGSVISILHSSKCRKRGK